jgi:hypothetical protein
MGGYGLAGYAEWMQDKSDGLIGQYRKLGRLNSLIMQITKHFLFRNVVPLNIRPLILDLQYKPHLTTEHTLRNYLQVRSFPPLNLL